MNAIEINGVDFTYPNGFTALRDIDLQIEKGEFVGIIGQNGAGKSTLLKNLTGLLRPTKGDILIGGENTKEISVGRLATKIGFVLQNPDRQLFADTVAEEVAYGPKNLGLSEEEVNRRVDRALEKAGIKLYSDHFPPSLAAGERAKVIIASVIAMQPDIIILDEPTTGQDNRGCFQIMDIAREFHQAGHTVIVVTHHMSLVAEYAERTIVFCQGEVLMDDSTQNVFGQPERIKKSYITPPQISQIGYEMNEQLGIKGRTVLRVEELKEQILQQLDQRQRRAQ